MRKLALPQASKVSFRLEPAAIKRADSIYRAIYHPFRLKILELVQKEGKMGITGMKKCLTEDSSPLQPQIKILLAAKLLIAERKEKQVFYSVNRDQVAKIQKLSAGIVPIPKTKPLSLTQKDKEAIREKFVKPKKTIFSEKELMVIRLICEQKTSEEIGAAMHISKRTVEDYRLRIIRKMQMKNTVGLVLYAVRSGIVSL